MPKYLLFLTGVGGWSGKGQKHPYVIQRLFLLEDEILDAIDQYDKEFH